MRFPLRIPTPLLLLPVPLAVVARRRAASRPVRCCSPTVASCSGSLAVVVGVPLAAFLVRSLHALSRRWFVIVPAGVVIVDPLILLDPVLMRRDRHRRHRPDHEPIPRSTARSTSGSVPAPAASPSRCTEPASFSRRRGRTDGAIVDTDIVLVAPIRRAEVLTTADGRRLAEALIVSRARAMPPPSTTSSS